MSDSRAALGRAAALATCLLLAACDAVVHVNATSNVPAEVTAVRITIEQVWLHQSATATADDTTWHKFRLEEARSIDLVDLAGGELTRIVGDLDVPAGTYRQIRLLLASRHDDLHDAADDAGARYNNEVTGFDEDDDEQTWPLEILNAEQGIGIAIDLEVVEAAVTAGTGTSVAGTVQVAFDAARDLTAFRYGGETGFLLNATLSAFDADDAGTIRGTLDLSQAAFDALTGRPHIQVTAQKLDEDLDRHVVVASTAVARNGSFVLYPLPLDEDESRTEYDLVIHGPDIRTIVIRDVPVAEGGPGIAAPLALAGVAPQAAESYEANLAVEAPLAPRGARVAFYQTLPGDDAPYLIGMAGIDPLSGRFAEPLRLSRAGTVSHGTYGPGFTLIAGTPEQGAGRYDVAAWSPQYGHGPLAATTLRPASPLSDVAFFEVPPISVPGSAVAGTVSATVTIGMPGNYDRGALLLAREGALVTLAFLDEALQQSLGSTFIDIPEVPAGSGDSPRSTALYQLEAWTWHSADPADTFTRHSGATVDLRTAASATAELSLQ